MGMYIRLGTYTRHEDGELTILLLRQEGSSPHTKLERTLGRLHKQRLLNSQIPPTHDE
jgi:hypothetical protein